MPKGETKHPLPMYRQMGYLSSQPLNQGQPITKYSKGHNSAFFSNCIVHKELLIPAPGLTIQIPIIPVHPRPPETFRHSSAHSKNHFPEVKNAFFRRKRTQTI